MDEKLYIETMEHMKAAAMNVQKLLATPGENPHPAIAKARYHATTHLEEANMWVGNGLAFIEQLASSEKIAEEALASGKMTVLPGGKQSNG